MMDPASLCLSCFSAREPQATCARCGWSEAGPGLRIEGQLRAGTWLRERYVVGRPLGRGGFSITYLAWDVRLQRMRAIKEYFPLGVVAREGDRPEVSVV